MLYSYVLILVISYLRQSGLQCQSLFSFHNVQCGKNVVHNSLELVDFAAVLYKEVNLKNQIKEALLHAVRD